MLIGYARVSTFDQHLDLQKDMLTKAGCDRIIEEQASGKNTQRQGLNTIKEILRPSDTLLVWRLDRLGRSLKDLIEWITFLEEKQVAFKSLQESIDTSTSSGKLIFHIFGALAEFERNLIGERTQAGLMAARARGRVGGRPPALSKQKQITAVQLYHDGKIPVTEICQMFHISKPTLYKYISQQKQSPSD
ncbi:MAG: DNA invertase Pin-like site-specific DNA recombinase [Saprospiraceae bacterium]|jgi:DNA invertase Pin-like site-specific DNA recombinase